MSLQIYNTLTNRKQSFVPLQANSIRMYVCGITVYDFCHIGHARVMVAFDVISRYLRSQGWSLEYVRNITDVDDKIIKRANENNESVEELTARMIEAMHQDEGRLGVLRPDQEPKATDHIQGIIDMVQTLIDKDFAYVAGNGDVYYRVAKFAEYGKLTNRNPEELLAGARVEVGEVKEDPRDFALWKAAKSDEVSWPAPWGDGRPGWHIECSAMSKACLGESFDIHGGGPDLPFPHHENEIAQSEAANGKEYARYWMHAGAVRVDGEKMSKSLGNFFTIRDVIEKYHPEVVRYLLVSSHYRSPINYSEDNLKEARTGLERFYSCLRSFPSVKPLEFETLKSATAYQRFVEVMNDDFNTREALSVMFELVREANSAESPEDGERAVATLLSLADILGLLQEDPEVFFTQGAVDAITAEAVESLITERQQAKLDKNYARADEIRQELNANGIVLEDSREGTKWRRE